MPPTLLKKAKTLGLICVFTSLAGVIFQLINETHLDYNSVTIGISLGLAFGLLELFVFPKAEKFFRRWSFTEIILFKTSVFTAVVFIVTVALATVAGFLESRKIKELVTYITSAEQMVLVAYCLVIYGLLVFFLQINQLLGKGVLWKFVLGKYHRPREEERIFMFLDMKSSTTIAERLGHVRFYALLNELFHEISQPVLQTKAEIYQYIGDEVILTWDLQDGLKNSNCLKTFFMFRERLRKKYEYYFKNFEVIPEFKAGLHFGKVVSAQIGDLKREIVYNGDVLNTTSRIQNECNKYNRDCLVSGTLLNRLTGINGFKYEKVDTVTLRGKETQVELFSVFNN